MILFGNIYKGLEEYRTTPGAILVDVREADEFKIGHIPGAVNEPLSTVSKTTLPKTVPSFSTLSVALRSMRRWRIRLWRLRSCSENGYL